MPRPVRAAPGVAGTYVPGLDGLRALAVLAVLGYHLGVPHMAGGLLGVGMFFTLSGFLITRILLSSFERTGTFELRRFWIHRTRRLLPAVVVLLVVVLAGTALTDTSVLRRRWGDSWSALLYVANWHTVARGQSYFDRFTAPGPLDHLWSLSVEEQFYLVWPLALVILVSVLHLSRGHLAGLTAAATVASFSLLSILAAPGFDHTRAYEGTDTRAGGILVGALLAMAWPKVVEAQRSRSWISPALQILGGVGLVVIGWLVATTDDFSLTLYDWGILTLSLATALLVAAVALPGSLVGRALGTEPLRWLGERSYGVYLWQLPVIAAVSTTSLATHRTAYGVGLSAITLLLAELSWRLVEDPIRRHGFTRAFRQLRSDVVPGPSSRRRALRIPMLPVGTACVVVLGIGTLVSCHDLQGDDSHDALALSQSGMPPIPGDVGEPGPGTPSPPPTSGPPGVRRASQPAEHAQHPRPGGATHERALTSCRSVVHVGESTSIGLVDPAYLPDPSRRLPAQLRHHGVRDVRTDILGARSIVERWHDQPNAQEGVEAQRARGYHGCWTIAMGTNDAANQAVGGRHPYAERIDLLMKAIGDQPVLWLTVKSLLGSGPYADANMRAFDDALGSACRRYPNLRIYDWRSEVRNSWFIPDGIHFTSAGYAVRAQRIGNALARAFPAGGPPSPACVVDSGLH